MDLMLDHVNTEIDKYVRDRTPENEFDNVQYYKSVSALLSAEKN